MTLDPMMSLLAREHLATLRREAAREWLADSAVRHHAVRRYAVRLDSVRRGLWQSWLRALRPTVARAQVRPACDAGCSA